MRRVLAIVLLLGVSGCAHRPARDRQNPTVEGIASHPELWDGRYVELQGLVVWEVHNVGLYRSYRDYCRGESLSRRTAIYVQWQSSSGLVRGDNRRMAVVAGIFRHRTMVALPDGTITVSTGAPGPGPLEEARIVQWVSEPLPSCP